MFQKRIPEASVGDPDPSVLGLRDSDPLFRGTDPAPRTSSKNSKKNPIPPLL
jgi:hypothetical protein